MAEENGIPEEVSGEENNGSTPEPENATIPADGNTADDAQGQTPEDTLTELRVTVEAQQSSIDKLIELSNKQAEQINTMLRMGVQFNDGKGGTGAQQAQEPQAMPYDELKALGSEIGKSKKG